MEKKKTQEEIKIEIESIDEKINGLELSRLDLGILKGNLLIQLKEITPHGEFARVLQEVSPLTNQRSAQRFMQLAENEELIRNATNSSQMNSVEDALKLIRKSKNQVQRNSTEKLIPVSEFLIKKNFDKENQHYNIIINIKAKDIRLLSSKVNNGALIKKVNCMIKSIITQRNLTDLSELVLN